MHRMTFCHLITSCEHAFNGTPLKSSAYSFDTLNRVTRRIDGATVTNTFGYNARSEVSSASFLSNAYMFAYDFIGNHTTSSVDTVETTYVANSLNQYSQVSVPSVPSVENLSYDLDGNMLTNGMFSYSWDAENRLVSVSSNGNLLVYNEYDFRHRRIRKTTPQATHPFVYNGWNPIHETITPTNGSVLEIEYFWGVDLSGKLQGAGGVGGLLAVSIDDSFFFPCFDNNGNVTAYVDESGNLVAEYTYDAFGEMISQVGSMADSFRYRFSTKYYDSETGLYYYGMRFYDPVLHRWLNRDPIEEQGGFNLYGFCENDPIMLTDYLGLNTRLEDMEAHAFLQAVVVAARATGRHLTAKFLAMYLNENNSGEYTLSDSEVMDVITNERFRDSVKKRARLIIVNNGAGSISHADISWNNHRFYPNLDPDFWSAYNDLRFKIELNGCVKKNGPAGLKFKGKLSLDLFDVYNFSNPGTAHRRPFQFNTFLPNRYENMTEQRFLDLETRRWVKPFSIKGFRKAKYSITVDPSDPLKTEMNYDPYN